MTFERFFPIAPGGSDLQARWVEALDDNIERALEFLAFVEGRLLAIHPFRDFNGQTIRVSLVELLRRPEDERLGRCIQLFRGCFFSENHQLNSRASSVSSKGRCTSRAAKSASNSLRFTPASSIALPTGKAPRAYSITAKSSCNSLRSCSGGSCMLASAESGISIVSGMGSRYRRSRKPARLQWGRGGKTAEKFQGKPLMLTPNRLQRGRTCESADRHLWADLCFSHLLQNSCPESSAVINVSRRDLIQQWRDAIDQARLFRQSEHFQTPEYLQAQPGCHTTTGDFTHIDWQLTLGSECDRFGFAAAAQWVKKWAARSRDDLNPGLGAQLLLSFGCFDPTDALGHDLVEDSLRDHDNRTNRSQQIESAHTGKRYERRGVCDAFVHAPGT